MTPEEPVIFSPRPKLTFRSEKKTYDLDETSKKILNKIRYAK